MMKGKVSLLALFGLMVFAWSSGAASSCLDHLQISQVRLQEIFYKMDGLQTRVFENWVDRDVEWRRLNFALGEALGASGVKVIALENETFAYRVLPEGQGRIARWAKILDKWGGIALIVSPSYWYHDQVPGALGGFHRQRRSFYIDQHSLVEGTLSAAGAHEAQHALNFHLSLKDINKFERIFQSAFSATSKADGRLPGLSVHHYDEYFSLDEIIAHRKSAKRLLSLKDRTSRQTAFLSTHFERISSFISHAQFLAELFQSAVLRERAEIHVRKEEGVVVYLTEFAGLFGFFGGAAGASIKGTAMELHFTETELKARDVRALVLERSFEIRNELALLYPLANELKNSWRTEGDSARTRELFQRFTAQIESRRLALRND